MVLARSKNKPPKPSRSLQSVGVSSLEIFMVCLITVVTLTALLMGLDWGGYIPQSIAFIGSKAMLAAQGPEPSFAATGYIFPPLLIYGSALLRSPVTLQVIGGTVLVGLILYTMSTVPVAKRWRSLWIILIFIHPAFGLMILREPVWIFTALFLFLAMQLMWQILQSQPDQDTPLSFLIVMVGLTFSGILVLRFEAWLGLFWLLLILWCLLLEETWQYRAASLFVVLTMSLFSMGTCCYLNWLAADDPLAFLHLSGSGLRLIGLDSLWIRVPPWEAVLMSLKQIVQVAPIFGLMVGWLLWQSQYRIRIGLLLTLPVILLCLSLWQGLYTPNLSQFGIYLALMPLLLQNLQSIGFSKKMWITMGLTLSFISSGWLLQQNQVIPEEALVWRKLTHQDVSTVQTVQELDQKTAEQREIAAYLFQRRRPKERILMDDGMHFPILYRLQNTQGLILPHQYEFKLAVDQPEQWAHFIVMSGAKSPIRNLDKVRSQLAQQVNGSPESDEVLTLKDFRTVFNSPYYQVLQR